MALGIIHGWQIDCMIRVAGPRMPHYRVYIFNEGGDLAGAVDFDCFDDEEAIERVEQLGAHDAELWRQIQPLERDEAEQC